MKKLIFLLLALCLSSPVFSATVTDSVTVATDGFKGVPPSGSYVWATSGGSTPYRYLQFGDNSGSYYTSNIRFDLSGAKAIPANATITSFTIRFFNTTKDAVSRNYYLKVAAFDSSTAPAITDSAGFNLQNSKLTTAQIDWDRTGTRDSTYYTTAECATVLQELVTDNSGVNGFVQLFVSNDGGAANAYYRMIAAEETGYTARMATAIWTYTTPASANTRAKGQRFPAADMKDGRVW